MASTRQLIRSAEPPNWRYTWSPNLSDGVVTNLLYRVDPKKSPQPVNVNYAGRAMEPDTREERLTPLEEMATNRRLLRSVGSKIGNSPLSKADDKNEPSCLACESNWWSAFCGSCTTLAKTIKIRVSTHSHRFDRSEKDSVDKIVAESSLERVHFAGRIERRAVESTRCARYEEDPLYETGSPSGHLLEDASGPTKYGVKNLKRAGIRKAHGDEVEV